MLHSLPRSYSRPLLLGRTMTMHLAQRPCPCLLHRCCSPPPPLLQLLRAVCRRRTGWDHYRHYRPYSDPSRTRSATARSAPPCPGRSRRSHHHGDAVGTAAEPAGRRAPETGYESEAVSSTTQWWDPSSQLLLPARRSMTDRRLPLLPAGIVGGGDGCCCYGMVWRVSRSHHRPSSRCRLVVARMAAAAAAGTQAVLGTRHTGEEQRR